MYTFYTSVCRLLSPNPQELKKSYSYTSFDSKVNIEKTPYIDTECSKYSEIASMNDAGEVIVLEYNIYDKTFVQYRPKFKR
jgi:hypothetical protein